MKSKKSDVKSVYNILAAFRRGFSVPWVPEAFHARFPVSSLQSDPREKPLDQNLDVLLIGSLEMSNVSNALIG